VLKTRKDIQETVIPLLEWIYSPATSITDLSLAKKFLKLKRWATPLIEEHNIGVETLHKKFIEPKKFGLNKVGGFLSGDKEEFDKYLEENKGYLEEEIPELDLKIKESEIEGSKIPVQALMLLDEAGILEE
jgi:hypothetical protein